MNGTHASRVLARQRCAYQIEIEAGMRSPLHIPASTHGHLAATELEKLLIPVAATTNSVRVQRRSTCPSRCANSCAALPAEHCAEGCACTGADCYRQLVAMFLPKAAIVIAVIVITSIVVIPSRIVTTRGVSTRIAAAVPLLGKRGHRGGCQNCDTDNEGE